MLGGEKTSPGYCQPQVEVCLLCTGNLSLWMFTRVWGLVVGTEGLATSGCSETGVFGKASPFLIDGITRSLFG